MGRALGSLGRPSRPPALLPRETGRICRESDPKKELKSQLTPALPTIFLRLVLMKHPCAGAALASTPSNSPTTSHWDKRPIHGLHSPKKWDSHTVIVTPTSEGSYSFTWSGGSLPCTQDLPKAFLKHQFPGHHTPEILESSSDDANVQTQ
jgi:hypothetical protein